MTSSSTRSTIFVEEARVFTHERLPGNYHLLRLYSPNTAAHARPGNFVHLQCAPVLALRRPMSLLRVEPSAGWIEILYRVHGVGTEFLARKQPGEIVNLMGPIGVPFKLQGYRRRPLLLGAGYGIAPLVFLAQHLKGQDNTLAPLVLLGSEAPFPFKPRPSRIMVPGMPAGVIAAMPLMDDWGVASRLTSLKNLPGCFEGFVTELARIWLEALSEGHRSEVEIFACGPKPMLKACAALAKTYRLPCQISLEAHMACAVGGCLGCVVRIQTEAGPMMKRVCVDGPVFDAATVVFQ